MEATSTLLPSIKPKIYTTVTSIIISDATPSPIDITLYLESDYTEAQFYADLRKSSKKLDSMVKRALKEDARGKTRKFPS